MAANTNAHELKPNLKSDVTCIFPLPLEDVFEISHCNGQARVNFRGIIWVINSKNKLLCEQQVGQQA
jgi:hypothetical protein